MVKVNYIPALLSDCEPHLLSKTRDFPIKTMNGSTWKKVTCKSDFLDSLTLTIDRCKYIKYIFRLLFFKQIGC